MKILKIYTDFLEDMEELSDAEKGRLFVMMLTYAGTGEEIPTRGKERYLWSSARKMIKAQRETYDNLCERNRKNGMNPKRSQTKPNEAKSSDWVQEQEQEQDKEQEKKKKTRARKYNRVIDGYEQSPIGNIENMVILGGKKNDAD